MVRLISSSCGDIDRVLKNLVPPDPQARHRSVSFSLGAKIEFTDVGFQCRDHTSILYSCPTFQPFVPLSLSRNSGTPLLLLCIVLH